MQRRAPPTSPWPTGRLPQDARYVYRGRELVLLKQEVDAVKRTGEAVAQARRCSCTGNANRRAPPAQRMRTAARRRAGNLGQRAG